MNGAESLVHTLLDGGVEVCFTNPGTSEMHFVAALDRVPGMRCVLGLFEGVVTGAADGYYRMTDHPAATLLHLGPGLGNGLANLHNARKARSGIVNVVGDHATAHLALDAPLTSDIAGIARPMSHWVQRSASADDVARDGREAIVQARARPSRIATLILPADAAWSPVTTERARLGPVPEAAAEPLDETPLAAAAEALRTDGPGTLLLLGDRALRERATRWAGRIAAATGCGVMAAFYGARLERGAGRVAIPRLPYAVEPALAALARWRRIVLVGASDPVAFFAYPGKPGRLAPPGCELLPLATPVHDAEATLEALADRLGARRVAYAGVPRASTVTPPDDAPLNPATLGALLAAVMPEGAVVVDEAVSTGRGFDALTAGAAPHDWLTGMGGSIGFGLPAAVGAAIGAPGRRVIALSGDGSAMYTPQALWTMARENLDVTVVIFANHAYQILRGEFAGVGAGEPGQRATDMLVLDRPRLDWQALARGHGLPATRVATPDALADALRRSFATPGPSLLEVVLA
ncbi:MAG: acetolactate synthase large subunit [Rubrivivax sp.]|nr:acetolactate synthase large subunit [Rubrivivax sp.]